MLGILKYIALAFINITGYGLQLAYKLVHLLKPFLEALFLALCKAIFPCLPVGLCLDSLGL